MVGQYCFILLLSSSIARGKVSFRIGVKCRMRVVIMFGFSFVLGCEENMFFLILCLVGFE